MKKTFIGKNLPIILITCVILVGLGLLVFSGNSSPFDSMFSGAKGGLPGNANLSKTFEDSVCKASFLYPESWEQSLLNTPLFTEPASQVTFDAPQNSSVFTYVCLKGVKPTFDQLMGTDTTQNAKKQRISGNTWVRWGPFAYLEKGDRLFIVQMFATKYDINPNPEYENLFQSILHSMKDNP